jgi:hypothetical protein
VADIPVVMQGNIPVIWGYFFDEVIGAALIEDDGSVTMRITDPRIKQIIEQDKRARQTRSYPWYLTNT